LCDVSGLTELSAVWWDRYKRTDRGIGVVADSYVVEDVAVEKALG
jgi:hypothetical protein